jgi:hypothetical protein
VEVADEVITDLARRLGRPRDVVAKELQASGDPRETIAKLDRAARRLAFRLVKQREAREADETAREARDRYEQRRREQDLRDERLRLRMTIGQRLDVALTMAQTLATARSASLDSPVAGSKPESKIPPKAQSDTFERWRMVMERLVENLEDEVDREKRAPLESTKRLATKEERDRRLRTRWKGWSSYLVSALDPELGSPRTIENSRAEMGYRRIDGEDLPAANGTRSDHG